MVIKWRRKQSDAIWQVVVGVSGGWRHGWAWSSCISGVRGIRDGGAERQRGAHAAERCQYSQYAREAPRSMWGPSSQKRLRPVRRLFSRCGQTSKRKTGLNEPRLRQFCQLFNICPAGQTRSHDGVYLWQSDIRKTLSSRRHQPVGPGGVQRRRLPFQRGKFMSPYFLWLFVTMYVVFKPTRLEMVCLFVFRRSLIARKENSLNQTHPYSLFRQEPDLRRGGANRRSWAISGAAHLVWPPKCAHQYETVNVKHDGQAYEIKL